MNSGNVFGKTIGSTVSELGVSTHHAVRCGSVDGVHSNGPHGTKAKLRKHETGGVGGLMSHPGRGCPTVLEYSVLRAYRKNAFSIVLL